MMLLPGAMRAADQRGVDIIQNCEVTDFIIENGTCTGVKTSRGKINAGKIGVAVAGSTSRVMAKAGLRLPIESHVLQAFVSEGVKTGYSRRNYLWRWTFLHQPV